jgi:hypothetical protein
MRDWEQEGISEPELLLPSASFARLKDREGDMSNTAVLMTDMGILVGIFLLGFLAKLFPRSGRRASSKQ